jgi:hypothetical protein
VDQKKVLSFHFDPRNLGVKEWGVGVGVWTGGGGCGWIGDGFFGEKRFQGLLTAIKNILILVLWYLIFKYGSLH